MSDELMFVSEDEDKTGLLSSWKVLIVDDDDAIHIITNRAIQDIIVFDKSLDIYNAKSAQEAKKLLSEHNDFALALIDVVMETPTAGLDLVNYIRNDLKNEMIRLVIRTGQPHEAPEQEVISKYDINDYKEKTELSALKLFTMLRTSIEQYNQLLQLQINQNYLQNVFEATPNIMIITDGEKIDRANIAMLEFIGYGSIEEFKEKHDCISDMFIEAEGLLSPIMSNITWLEYTLENQKVLHKVKMLKGNKKYSFLVRAKPLTINKNKKSVVTFTDVTELDEAYKALNEKDEIMLSQSRNAAMGEIISMIAHQWRQPISTIAMGINNILINIEIEMIDVNVLKDSASKILKQTQELSKIIDDFRSFFKPNKQIENVLIEDVFKDVYSVIGQSLEYNHIKIVTHYNSSKNIQTYSNDLMQVFINIVKNAKEAMEENGIEDGKINIFIDDIKNAVSIKICDNAGGIKGDIIKHIFEPYFSTKSEKNGTGLGLYMSKTIVEKHLHGIFYVKSIDSGVCFIIELPYTIGNEEKNI